MVLTLDSQEQADESLEDSYLWNFVSYTTLRRAYYIEIAVRLLTSCLILTSVGLIAASHWVVLARCSYYSSAANRSVLMEVRLWRLRMYGRQTWFEDGNISTMRTFMVLSLVGSVTAWVLSVLHAYLRLHHEGERQREDLKRTALQKEFFALLSRYRKAFPERSAEVAKVQQARPLPGISGMTLEEEAAKSWEYAMVPYQLREASRSVSDRYWAISIFSILFINTVALAVSVGFFTRFYNSRIKVLTDPHLEEGFFETIAAMVISLVVCIKMPVTFVRGMHIFFP